MKKSLIIILLLFLCINIVYADDTPTDVPTEDATKIETARAAIKKYCDEGGVVNGCLYKDNIDSFSKIDKKVFSTAIGDIYKSMTVKNVELTRGYQAFDGAGNAVFAGCYKYVVNNDYFDEENNLNVGKGTYFLFEIYTPEKNGTCKYSTYSSDMIPSKGAQISFTSKNTGITKQRTFDGITPGFSNFNVSDYGEDQNNFATLGNWVAVDGGDCPKVFGYSANAKWYNGNKLRYAFSENLSDYNADIILDSWIGRDKKFTRNPGCTVEDKSGKETNEELLNEVKVVINNKTCPDKIENLISLHESMEDWYKEIRESNEYRVLWARDLADEVTIEKNSEEIRKTISEKITSCNYKICGVTDEEIKTINNNRGTKCKEGCRLNNVQPQSEAEDAICWKCGLSGNPYYLWATEDGKERYGSCQQETSMSKVECIGTEDDRYCRNCMSKAYKASLDDETKITCLIDSELMKDITNKNLEDVNKKVAGDDVDKEMQLNSEAREKIYNHLQASLDVSRDEMTCTQILGETLSKVIKGGIIVIQIAAGIVALLKGMIVLIPPLVAKDADAIKKASGTLVKMGIILVLVLIFRPFVRLVGSILHFDVSCIL